MSKKIVLMLAVIFLVANSATAELYTIEIDADLGLIEWDPIPDGTEAVAGVFDTTFVGWGGADIPAYSNQGYTNIDGNDGAVVLGSGGYGYVDMRLAAGGVATSGSFELAYWDGAAAFDPGGAVIAAGFEVWTFDGVDWLNHVDQVDSYDFGLASSYIVTTDAATNAALAANPGAVLSFKWGPNGNYAADNFAAEINPVPEPSTFVLAVLGLVGLAFYGLRRRNR